MEIHVDCNPSPKDHFFISVVLNDKEVVSFDKTTKGHRLIKQIFNEKKKFPDNTKFNSEWDTLVINNGQFIKESHVRWMDLDNKDWLNEEIWETVWEKPIKLTFSNELLNYSQYVSDNYKNLNLNKTKEFERKLISIAVFEDITEEIKKLEGNPENIKDYSHFHKDDKKHISLSKPIIRKFSADEFRKIKNLDKNQIFDICENLLNYKKDSFLDIAFDWAFRIKKQYLKEDFFIFENWLEKYVDTWGNCDDFCTHAFGYFLVYFPEYITKISEWVMTDNKWKKRASAVILIYSFRKNNKFLGESFKIAKSLFHDKEDLVQKGYGWMLKEASKRNQKEVYNFISENKKQMSRIALRYSIEKMPEKLRRELMK